MVLLVTSKCLIGRRLTTPIRIIFGASSVHTTATINHVLPKNLKGKSVSSQQWLTRHLNDPYVARAQKSGFRARSAFKLTELNSKYNLLKPGQWIVDCGAAPGAWTQVCVSKINSDGKKMDLPVGKIISIDLLPIEPIPGAILLPKYDFTDARAREEIISRMRQVQEEDELPEEEKPPLRLPDQQDDIKIFDGILSDMAPNATGDSETDHYRIVNLVRTVIEFAESYGKEKSFLVLKLWDGPESTTVVKELQKLYGKVFTTKPNASRGSSSEKFIIAVKKR